MDITAALVCAELAIKELLDSSSSSDEDFFIELPKKNEQSGPKCFVRDVVHAYSNAEFKKKFGISRKTVTHLIERYSQSYSKRRYKGGRTQTSIEKEVLAFLWFSANAITFREVSNIFSLSLSTMHKCFSNVLKFLADDLAPETIKFPRLPEEKESIADGFNKVSEIPNILGCIDRCDTSVSTTIQAICDSNLMFLDIFVGNFNQINNREVLKRSFVGKELPKLCSPNYYLLGDSTYQLNKYIITPYEDDRSLSVAENNYNTNFRRAWVKIEDAFRLLKCRFPQLTRMDFRMLETTVKFVTACCVLHNICIQRNESPPEEIFNNELNNSNVQPIENDSRDILAAQLQSDEVKNILNNETS